MILQITAESAAKLAGLLPRTYFLEHVCDRARGVATREIVAARGTGHAYVSLDLGKTWVETDLTGKIDGLPTQCFTLSTGKRLVRARDSSNVLVVDREWNVESAAPTSSLDWHGSWSIDEGPTGTIMYGEYGARPEVVRIWRSVNGGANWAIAFEKAGDEFFTGRDAVRHFHTCQADQARPKRWTISSGDRKEHCRLWLSDNDGLSWTELRITSVEGIDLSEPLWPRLLRHTAEVWQDDSIYWPTDDLLGRGKAAFVRFDLQNGKATVLCDLGPNEMRALVAVTAGEFIAISESKLKIDTAEVFAVTREGGCRLINEVMNMRQIKSGFTRSICSRYACDGIFFSYDDGGLVEDENCRLIRWNCFVPAVPD